jgi:Uncharacterised nucleotidyltransferase
LELLPPRIRNPAHLKLLGDILNTNVEPTGGLALRLRLMDSDFSWQALIDLATQQDLLPALIQALSERALLPPVPRAAPHQRDGHVTRRLQQSYREHLARRKLQKTQMQNVLRHLNGAGIVPLILKGARYLVAAAAAWCEARTFRDIDLLVRPEQADRAFAELVDAGYRPSEPYMANYHHLPDLQHSSEPASVEIHTATLAVAGQSVMSTELAWRSATKAADGSFYVLPLEWQALHCLLHHQLSDRGYVRRILALKPLWEWTMLTGDWSRTQWQTIFTHMREVDALDLLGSWLVQADRLFGAPIPEFVPISSTASANASETLGLAFAPHWRRRTNLILDQLRYSFSKDTLGAHYGKTPATVSVADGARYAIYLIRTHRGRLLRRLIGYRDRLS